MVLLELMEIWQLRAVHTAVSAVWGKADRCEKCRGANKSKPMSGRTKIINTSSSEVSGGGFVPRAIEDTTAKSSGTKPGTRDAEVGNPITMLAVLLQEVGIEGVGRAKTFSAGADGSSTHQSEARFIARSAAFFWATKELPRDSLPYREQARCGMTLLHRCWPLRSQAKTGVD